MSGLPSRGPSPDPVPAHPRGARRAPWPAWHTARRPAGRRTVCQAGHGARRAPRGCAGTGSGLGPRDGNPLIGRGRHRSGRHQGRHPHPAQRMPPQEAASGLGPGHEGIQGTLMARYTGPVCRLCRRERTKLFLKGERCYSMKCPVSEAVTDRHSRAYPPGEHGRDRMRQGSEYLGQLREKQKARRIYGLLERQFHNLYVEASKAPGITGENLLRMLELRLDNVAFRAGWGASRSQARQFVRHGHVLVNGKRVTIPSYRVRQGDVVTLKPSSRELFHVRRNMDTLDRQLPPWLEAVGDRFEVRVFSLPLREHIDEPVQEQLIVELYSK